MSVDKIREIFKRRSEELFLIDTMSDKRFKYSEIEDLSSRIAYFLENKGLKKKDRLVLLLPNHSVYVFIYFACMQLGVIPVPVNLRLKQEEIDTLLDSSGYSKILTTGELSKNVSDNNNRIIINLGKFLNEVKKLKRLSEDSFPYIKDEDTIIIIFTSGTTNRPKGIMIKYSHLINNGILFCSKLNLKNPRFVEYLSMAYLGGFYNLMMIPFLAEGSIVLTKEFIPASAINFWEMTKKYNIDSIWFVPAIMSMLMLFDKSRVPQTHIKNSLVGTAPLTLALKKKFEERYSLELFENYGLSETLFISTNSPNNKMNYGVGPLLEGVKISFLNEDVESDKGPGEIIVESDYIMRKYLHEDSVNQLRFHTGDVGYLDDSGYLFITDRKKDLIIVGGINISPKEVEETIMKFPGIEKVAVIGIPHKIAGEEIIAVIGTEKELDAREIKEHCSNLLAPFKVPQRIIFRSDFPVSVTGKIQKKELKSLILGES